MLNSEQSSLVRFLLIYLGSTFLLFSLASWIFYVSSKHHLLDEQQEILKYQSENIKSKLRLLHKSFDGTLVYPGSTTFDSAIYDLDKAYIFGTFENRPILEQNDHYNDEKRLYHVVKIEPHYLGAAYLMVSKEIDKGPISALQEKIIWFMLAAGVFFTTLGYFLGRLFTAPMRDSIEQMNHFIQDTTHELNTPLSAILANIEMMDRSVMVEKNKTKLSRINIAAKTVSVLYKDLMYLTLEQEKENQDEEINIKELIENRVEYFSILAQSKNLEFTLDLEEVNIIIDRRKLTRVIDNLISNAIKSAICY